MPPPIPEPFRALIQEEFEQDYSNDAIIGFNMVPSSFRTTALADSLES